MKRKVFDIMWAGPDNIPVSYDLAGLEAVAYNRDSEKGYQAICPWCAQNLGDCFQFAGTYGSLYDKLYGMTKDHISFCKNKDRVDPFNDLEVKCDTKTV